MVKILGGRVYNYSFRMNECNQVQKDDVLTLWMDEEKESRIQGPAAFPVSVPSGFRINVNLKTGEFEGSFQTTDRLNELEKGVFWQQTRMSIYQVLLQSFPSANEQEIESKLPPRPQLEVFVYPLSGKAVMKNGLFRLDQKIPSAVKPHGRETLENIYSPFWLSFML
jgi:hypothetical protein